MDVEVLGVGADLPQPVVLARLAQDAKRHLVRPRMFSMKYRGAIPRRADFEQQDVETFVDQDVRGYAASGARSDNYRVINDSLLGHRYTLCNIDKLVRQKGDSQNTITYSGCPWLHSVFSFSSECQLEPELNIPSRRRAVDRAESVAIRIDVRVLKIDKIPGVKEIALELQSDFLSEGEALAQGNVPQMAPWPYDHAHARRAAAFIWRIHERCCVEPIFERPRTFDILPRSVSAPCSDGTVAHRRQSL